MSFQTDTIYAYLEMELVLRNWPAKNMDMDSEIENITMLSTAIQQARIATSIVVIKSLELRLFSKNVWGCWLNRVSVDSFFRVLKYSRDIGMMVH